MVKVYLQIHTTISVVMSAHLTATTSTKSVTLLCTIFTSDFDAQEDRTASVLMLCKICWEWGFWMMQMKEIPCADDEIMSPLQA